ncbi:NAD(+) synthase [Butyricicoccus porcorum]|uniref:Glutamine-dependent NAD(+) synthetase n=1 Tax=Butyricicoccus porcorum TaxID=1945634 RepID=A0A252F4P1_9FIRM|nr:NAD(+) synthase [Butyricicoccus porcorum]MCI6927038.1 NAD(+) synthase [Butyricicoccus porcorum]MDD6987217.1 NAD(+) synthase [Butyricicoccus porcorum]OUM20736.1 NAD(+) synthase [Butyricicoccus porcorum]
MKDGFIKVAAATPEIHVADCAFNADNILALCREANEKGVQAVCFPELCLTGYTCSDLFLHNILLDGAKQQLLRIAGETAEMDMLIVVGLPVRVGGTLYNCAAFLHKGNILGMIPKRNIPNYTEFYELRHFTEADDDTEEYLEWDGQEFCIDPNQIFCCTDLPDFAVSAEICEDLWVPNPPSSDLACAGATILFNLSASDEIIGKAAYRRNLVCMQSGRGLCGYIYCDAGQGESSTDLVFAAHNIIAENGTLLAQSPRFATGLTISEIDVTRLTYERRRQNTFREGYVSRVWFDMELRETELTRPIAQTPFVPSDKGDLAARCEEILTLQATGLATRVRHAHAKTAVVGLSGGLDSALALIVTVHAFDLLGRDRRDIIAVTMPCFGTTSRTKNNALTLAAAYGTTCKTIEIGASVTQHFIDIGHDMEDHSVTFENGQARERTQVLMDLANKTGGMVIGTGDLSELALGWATYNGDHMSMYGVNSSIPKTLVRYLTAYEADRAGGETGRVLRDVLATPVSPELLPPKDGEISQKTEELVGPYELHDFFLYYLLRFGMEPKKIFRMAKQAFAGVYDDATIKKWLTTFVRRFFIQQFKRSCLPDGPKVGTVTLSPRGDWRMPSDAVSALWMEQCEQL